MGHYYPLMGGERDLFYDYYLIRKLYILCFIMKNNHSQLCNNFPSFFVSFQRATLEGPFRAC